KSAAPTVCLIYTGIAGGSPDHVPGAGATRWTAPGQRRTEPTPHKPARHEPERTANEVSDANPRKRGQGRGKRRTDSGPRTGPSSRGRRSRPPRRDAARSADSAAPMDAASPDATTPDTCPTVPGDRANPTYHIETGDSGFIGDAPLPDGEGADLGD